MRQQSLASRNAPEGGTTADGRIGLDGMRAVELIDVNDLAAIHDREMYRVPCLSFELDHRLARSLDDIEPRAHEGPISQSVEVNS
jgi:hypothetical protein